MLNFTAGEANLKAAIRTAGVKKVLTARRFIDQAKLDDLNKKNLLTDETTLKRVTDGIAAVKDYAKTKDFSEQKVEKMF